MSDVESVAQKTQEVIDKFNKENDPLGVLTEPPIEPPAPDPFAGRAHPGEKIDGKKVPWTMSDVKIYYPDTTWTPEENITVTCFGHTLRLLAGHEVTAPSCFKGIYDTHRTSKIKPKSTIETNSGHVTVSLGAGGLEPEKVTTVMED